MGQWEAITHINCKLGRVRDLSAQKSRGSVVSQGEAGGWTSGAPSRPPESPMMGTAQRCCQLPAQGKWGPNSTLSHMY